jgi:hypothetical protein
MTTRLENEYLTCLQRYFQCLNATQYVFLLTKETDDNNNSTEEYSELFFIYKEVTLAEMYRLLRLHMMNMPVRRVYLKQQHCRSVLTPVTASLAEVDTITLRDFVIMSSLIPVELGHPYPCVYRIYVE